MVENGILMKMLYNVIKVNRTSENGIRLKKVCKWYLVIEYFCSLHMKE